MRKIIDGRVYDTATATELCDISPHGYSRGDFQWEDTYLYRSPRGRFFIAGCGNAMSRWATSVGQSGRGPGEGLRVIDDDEARQLYERHGDSARYTEIFGEPEEG